MQNLYVLLPYSSDWEDIVIILTEIEAIKASIKYPKRRVEIFEKTEEGYIPTYNYYREGQLIKNMDEE